MQRNDAAPFCQAQAGPPDHLTNTSTNQSRNRSCGNSSSSQDLATASRSLAAGDGLRSRAKPAPVQQKRPQQEILKLRAKVAQLEAAMDALQGSHRQQRNGSNGTSRSDPVSDAWAQMARRQLGQRRKAQAENDRLRESLRAQVKVGNRLMRLFRRAIELQESAQPTCSLSGAASSHQRMHDPISLSHVDAIYRERNNLFAAQRFGDTSMGSFRDGRCGVGSKRVPDGFDAHAGWAFPTSVVRGLDAIWKVSLARIHAKETSMGAFERFPAPPDMAVISFATPGLSLPESGSDTMDMQCEVVFKEFYDPMSDEGVVVSIWSGSLVHGSTTVVYTVEELVRIQDRPELLSEEAHGPVNHVAHIQTCSRVRRRSINQLGKPLTKLEDALVSGFKTDLRSRQHAIEDRLVRPHGPPSSCGGKDIDLCVH